MNLDELQSVQARERQSSDLQHLRASFYREVGEYIQELTEKRDELVDEAEDPFAVPAVRQLTDDIETAEQTIEAIYERRVGKVVKKASIAAAGMPVGDEGLTAEESELFDDLVSRIEENRETVLSVLDGGSSSGIYSLPDADGSSRAAELADSDTDSAAAVEDDGESTTDGVSAADLMGAESPAETEDRSGGSTSEVDTSEVDTTTADTTAADTTEDESSPTEVPPEPEQPGRSPDETDDTVSSELAAPAEPEEGGQSGGSGQADEPDRTDESAPTDEPDRPDDQETVPGVPRTTVRITADVGEVVGADNRDYDLNREDVVTLPEANAQVLVDNDAAERLD